MKKGSVHSLDTRKKMSKIRKGKTLKELGHKIGCSCSVCKVIRGETKGKKHPRYVKRIKKVCEQCNVKFEATVFSNNRNRFCSKECYSKWQSKNQVGKNNSNWRKKIKKNCVVCGKEFEVIPSRKKAKFCSKECMSSFVKLSCLNCSTIFEVPLRRKNSAKFCSHNCYTMYVRGEKHHCWVDGGSFKPYTKEFNQKLKEEIRKRDNYICHKCNITEEEHLIVYGKILSVHHIDYNKNNSIETNLITLCNECNLRVNHNRNYWTGYFKELLEKKYGFAYH